MSYGRTAYEAWDQWQSGRVGTSVPDLEWWDFVRCLIDERSMPEPNSGCWLWLSSLRKEGGYGCFKRDYRTYDCHRESWSAFNERPIPIGMFICHKCDVRSCVNPDHLFVGTHLDNMADMSRKGRTSRRVGERSPSARLKREQVIAIRADNRTIAAIAADYGVSTGCIDHILARRNWRHI